MAGSPEMRMVALASALDFSCVESCPCAVKHSNTIHMVSQGIGIGASGRDVECSQFCLHHHPSSFHQVIPRPSQISRFTRERMKPSFHHSPSATNPSPK